jgi:four helix bundle protein
MAIAKSFRELNVYSAARAAAREVYEITRIFPRDERFSLTDQIRRSSRATKAMIAEAWVRRRYRAVFINKLSEALGEAAETQSWLDDAVDAAYINAKEFRRLDAQWSSVGAMLARMIDRASDFCKNASETNYRGVSEEAGEYAWDAVIRNL